MAKIILRQKAIDDLNDIWNYTFEEWSMEQADKYYASIEQSCIEIGKNAAIGRVYREISKKILGLKSGKHIIFYQTISADRIEIVRILHQRMDLKNKLTK